MSESCDENVCSVVDLSIYFFLDCGFLVVHLLFALDYSFEASAAISIGIKTISI
jgi:hypothetical protein